MTYTEAAVEVLRLVGRPLHYKKIAQLAVERGLLSHVGKSPEVTMSQRLATLLRKDRGDSPIVKVKPGVFGLKEFSSEVLEAAREGDTHSMEVELPEPSAEEDGASEEGPGGESAEEEPIPTPSLPGVGTFPEEEDDDEPLLARREEDVSVGPAEGDDSEDGRSNGKKKRRRRRRKSKDREDAAAELPARRGSNEPLASAVRPVAETLADAVEDILQGGPRQRRSFVDVAKELVQRGRLEGAARSLAPTVAAAIRGDEARRRAEARRLRFRVSSQGVSLVAWEVPGDATRAEREARRHAARQRRRVREELVRRLDALPAEGFVELVASWLCAEGVSSIRGVLPPTGTSGYHLAGHLSHAGLEARLAVWVLRGVPVTRETVIRLRGALHHYGPASMGWIVTTGSIESDAKDEAAVPGAAPVALVDGARLAEALERAEIGVRRVHVPLAVLDVELLEQLGGARAARSQSRAEARRASAAKRLGESEAEPRSEASSAVEPPAEESAGRRRRRRRRSGPVSEEVVEARASEEAASESEGPAAEEEFSAAPPASTGSEPEGLSAGSSEQTSSSDPAEEGGAAPREEAPREAANEQSDAVPAEEGVTEAPGAEAPRGESTEAS